MSLNKNSVKCKVTDLLTRYQCRYHGNLKSQFCGKCPLKKWMTTSVVLRVILLGCKKQNKTKNKQKKRHKKKGGEVRRRTNSNG